MLFVEVGVEDSELGEGDRKVVTSRNIKVTCPAWLCRVLGGAPQL
jgi:hypothetical protein